MRRLYPQALKAEQSIQELRTSLLEAEAEGQGQRRQLLETDRQIRDLHGRLGSVEKQQRDIVHELYLVTLETEECQQQTAAARTEAAALVEDINAAGLRQNQGEAMLEEVAVLAQREREMLGLAQDDVALRRLQLLSILEENEASAENLAYRRTENQGVAEELAEAAQLSQEQAQSIAFSRGTWEHEAQRSEVANANLCNIRSEVDHWLKESRRNRTELIRAESLAQENAVMRETLTPRTQLNEDLTERMENAQQYSVEARAQLSVLEAQTSELGLELHESEVKVQDSRWLLDQAEDAYRTTENQLQSCRREVGQLKEKLAKTETGERTGGSEFEAKLKALEHREAKVIAEHKDMHAEWTATMQRKAELDQETRGMEDRLSKLEADCKKTGSHKAECLQQAMELDQKSTCGIS